jgi:transcriptional regulator of stress and heat shock response
MANISDIIEKFILDAMQEDDCIQISRNELANFFSCAPSQINYVLATRFSNERGFEIYSQRGGGGYIKLTKIEMNENDLISNILNDLLTKPIDYNTSKKLVRNLLDSKFFTKDESDVLLSCVTPKTLSSPIQFENNLRSQILKSAIVNKLTKNHKGGN